MMDSETRTCQQCKNQFEIELRDFEFYKRISVPPPTFCPECRVIRRLVFRNDRTLYKRKVEGTVNEVFSYFPSDSPLIVHEQRAWRDGKWDATQWGQDYDFSRPFFTQFQELMQKVPWPSGYNIQPINSDYCNNVDRLKDCYLMFNSGYSEKCAYSIDVLRSQEIFDSMKVVESSLCYEVLDSERCNRTFFSQNCVGCSEVYFSQNLADCHNCFGCINLRHQQHCVFNKQRTKGEYEKFMGEVNLGSHAALKDMKEKVGKHFSGFPRRYMHGHHNTDVNGDYLDHSNNTHDSFLCRDMENCRYCQLILFLPGKDSYDISVAGGELCYEIEEAGGFNVKFSWGLIPTDLQTGKTGTYDIEHSMTCGASGNLFGCVGLKNKQYCILNKQYTKEGYEKLVPKIVQHMNEMPYVDKQGKVYRYGEFFPVELSPFGYNETISQEYFPLTKEEALARGYAWREPREKHYRASLDYSKLPDKISEADDSILKETISCAHEGKCKDNCTTVFRLIPMELAFYRRFRLPLPRLCHNCRHMQRMAQRNPLHLWKRQCQCGGAKSENGVYTNTASHFHEHNPCPKELKTTYSPERGEIVYCEECFTKEVA